MTLMESIQFYKEMKKEDQDKIDWKTYSNLAAIFVKTEQFKKAESMLKKLEKVRKPRDREAYHCLLTLYAGTENVDEVYRVWNSLKSIDPVTNKSYLIMLSTLRRLKDAEGILECFKEWESKGVSYDARLISIAVSAYLNRDMNEEAELFFKKAIGNCRGPFLRIQEMFMMFYLEKGQLDSVVSHLEAALSEVTDDKQPLSPQFVSGFLKYYEKETDLDGFNELCNILKTHNLDESWLKTCMASSESSLEALSSLKEDSYVNNAEEN